MHALLNAECGLQLPSIKTAILVINTLRAAFKGLRVYDYMQKKQNTKETKEIVHQVKVCDVVKTDFKGLYLAM